MAALKGIPRDSLAKATASAEDEPHGSLGGHCVVLSKSCDNSAGELAIGDLLSCAAGIDCAGSCACMAFGVLEDVEEARGCLIVC